MKISEIHLRDAEPCSSGAVVCAPERGMDMTLNSSLSQPCFAENASIQMERMVLDFRQMYRQRNEAREEVTRAHHEALLRLSLAADFKDDDTGVHIVRIGYLSEALALLLGQTPRQAGMLKKAAPMHDIGKIGVPDSVLKKPGAFSAADRITMNQHPAIGAQILGGTRISLFDLAAEIALSHHERWDGQGYPAGKSGEQIPLVGRIVAVVDFFDALTMDRCYRKAFADDVALNMLASQRGLAFDPNIVDVFLANSGEMIALRERINQASLTFSDLIDVA